MNLSLRNNWWKFQTSGILPIILENVPQDQWRETERCQHVAGWTWKHMDLDRFCPKISLGHCFAQVARAWSCRWCPGLFVIQKLPPPKDGTPGDATVMEAFGSGRRMCPGYRVAIRMFHFTLARFLQSFDWSLPNDQDPTTLDMSDTTQFNLIKAEPLLVVPHARLPHHLY